MLRLHVCCMCIIRAALWLSVVSHIALWQSVIGLSVIALWLSVILQLELENVFRVGAAVTVCAYGVGAAVTVCAYGVGAAVTVRAYGVGAAVTVYAYKKYMHELHCVCVSVCAYVQTYGNQLLQIGIPNLFTSMP
jgi:hypothetical protein